VVKRDLSILVHASAFIASNGSVKRYNKLCSSSTSCVSSGFSSFSPVLCRFLLLLLGDSLLAHFGCSITKSGFLCVAQGTVQFQEANLKFLNIKFF
jgi:hypothetical protein